MPSPFHPNDLYTRLGTAKAPLLIDVRRREAFDADKILIIGAARRLPDDVSKWRNTLPAGKPIVAYCAHGHEVSQGVASTLRGAGMAASYLEGGIAGWQERKLPTRRKRDASENKWVTREHPKIDRIACPWLISRFVNPEAEFIYVPAAEVSKVAADVGGTPYDIKGVKFGHVGDQCSFDAIVDTYGIEDPALDRLATIVRGADTSRPDLTPQCEGLLAISYGLSSNFPRRPRNAEARNGHVRRPLHMVPTGNRKAEGTVIMSLKTIATIAIPGSAGSSFDHGAFDPATRRVFVAHTGRSCVEVIDHDAGKHIATLPDFPEAAGVVAEAGWSWSPTAAPPAWLGSMHTAWKRNAFSK